MTCSDGFCSALSFGPSARKVDQNIASDPRVGFLQQLGVYKERRGGDSKPRNQSSELIWRDLALKLDLPRGGQRGREEHREIPI